MKRFARNIWLIICFGIFGTGTIILSLYFKITKHKHRDRQSELNFYSKSINKLWNIFTKFLIYTRLISLNINDVEQFKKIKNSLIVATHTSYIDVLVLLVLIPKTTCLVAERLQHNFIMRDIVKAMFINANLTPDELIKKTDEMFNLGFNILIFPSGTRHHKNEHPKIKKGASYIAAHSKRNIVPIKITSDTDFLPINIPGWQAAGEKTPTFNIEIAEPIITQNFIEKYPDEVDLKHYLTKEIEKRLYFSEN